MALACFINCIICFCLAIVSTEAVKVNGDPARKIWIWIGSISFGAVILFLYFGLQEAV